LGAVQRLLGIGEQGIEGGAVGALAAIEQLRVDPAAAAWRTMPCDGARPRERVEVFERWDNDNVGAPA